MQAVRGSHLIPTLGVLGAAILACGTSDRDTSEGLVEGGEHNPACYEDTRVGCTDLSWSDIEQLIDVIFLQTNSYYGYDKEEATELARTIYDEGVYPAAWMEILGVQTLDDGRYRAWVAVTNPDGHPAQTLTADDFTITIDAGAAGTPAGVSLLRDAEEDDLDLALAVVVDDSGSIADCDANFIGEGLGYLFSALPPVYQAELIKFDREVVVVESWTRDGDDLAAAALNTCTERGSTALWDATYLALGDVPEADLSAVIVLSDGLDNVSARDLDDVTARARELDIPVTSIGLGSADIWALSELGYASGGAFVYVPSGEQTVQAFETVTEFILYAYAVEFDADSGWGALEVAATVEGGETVSAAWETSAASAAVRAQQSEYTWGSGRGAEGTGVCEVGG